MQTALSITQKGLFVLLIMIDLAFPRHQGKGNHGRHAFCQNNGNPYAINAKDERQNDNGRSFKHQGAQERNQRRERAVIERGKKARTKNGKARKEEGA